MKRPDAWVLPESVFVSHRHGSVPTYRDLAAKIEDVIRSGVIPPDVRLEDEQSLAVRLGISRPTVRAALEDLVDRGLLVRRRGIGTQVVAPGTSPEKLEPFSLWEELSVKDRKPSTSVLDCTLAAASDQSAKALGINPGAPVMHILRLRSAGGMPLSIMENDLPARFADITAAELERRGLYEVLQRHAVTIRVARQTVSATSASSLQARLLDVRRGAPLTIMTRTAFDDSGAVVETGIHLYRPDRYSFESTVVRS